jgi:asparagine synthase (glutamine-hydrolysing)
MCGIAGFFGEVTATADELAQRGRAMAATLAHRVPDDGGVWCDPRHGISLAHRRLSILDLSPDGHQPMESADSRYVIVFNGEIYNFKDIQSELLCRGHRFRGHSDTEVLLAAICEWGLETALSRSVGMFALALWDKQSGSLHLARDRLGEKPLYYGWIAGRLLFASELKALRVHPAWVGELDRDALGLYLRFNYIPSPYCIYKGIRKLPPGTYLTIDSSAVKTGVLSDPCAYWALASVAKHGDGSPFVGGDDDAVARLESILDASVAQQMVADVPVGAFLSGGIDSSTIVALMQKQSARPVRTFSIGFRESRYNEAAHARRVAEHLKTEHTELYVSSSDSLAVIPKLPQIYDEPFADPSQIPTFLVSRLARQQVTVSLSGDAGDELFCGYTTYFKAEKLWQSLSRFPVGIRCAMRAASEAIPRGVSRAFGTALAPIFQGRNLAHKMEAFNRIAAAPSRELMYRDLVAHWTKDNAIMSDFGDPQTAFEAESGGPKFREFMKWMMFVDCQMYLPDDILVKVDRAAMAVSLETRVPLLDHRVVEFAWSLPMRFKVRDGVSKWLLREVLYKYVPRELIERPKMGFSVPVGDWLRGELREWAEEMLSDSRIKRDGYLNAKVVRRKWTDHLSGAQECSQLLWNLLMLESWFEAEREKGSAG